MVCICGGEVAGNPEGDFHDLMLQFLRVKGLMNKDGKWEMKAQLSVSVNPFFLNRETGLKQIIVVSRYISMLSEKLWILK